MGCITREKPVHFAACSAKPDPSVSTGTWPCSRVRPVVLLETRRTSECAASVGITDPVPAAQADEAQDQPRHEQQTAEKQAGVDIVLLALGEAVLHGGTADDQGGGDKTEREEQDQAATEAAHALGQLGFAWTGCWHVDSSRTDRSGACPQG
jgi:hypothetical protein